MLDLFSQPDLTIPRNKHQGNQDILSENRTHFSGQAKIVLDLLLKGESVSSAKMIQYGIIDTRARIFSIEKKLQIEIPERKIPGAKGAKEWYPTAELITEINNKLNGTNNYPSPDPSTGG